MNITTVQLLLRFTSLHQTGNDLHEDPTTRGSEPLNGIWDLWTPVLPTRGRSQPLENTGVRLWTRLHLRRTVCYEEEKKKTAICYSAVQATWPWVCLFVYLPISVYLCPCLSVKVGVLSRRMDGSSLFLAYRLPSTYPVLQKNLDTLTKIIIPSSATLAVKVSPSRPTTRRYSQLLST